ncbi:D-beta-hydroxybutyrate dehydrogenase, mitochondrial-like [Glandiceps talaboti]
MFKYGNYELLFLVEVSTFLGFVAYQHFEKQLKVSPSTLVGSILLGLPLCQDIIGGFIGALLFAVLCIVTYHSFLSSPLTDELEVNQRTVLITGCDTGFGYETVKYLDKLGLRVFAGCLEKGGTGERNLQAICSERVTTLQLDITSDEQVENAVQLVRSSVGENGLWGLVNNAGVTSLGAIELLPMETFDKIYQVNLLGTIRVTKAFLSLVRRAKGRIVNISSTLGSIPVSPCSAYCISKAGVEMFSDVLRQEMLDWDVKVSVIQPAGFQTQILSKARQEAAFHHMMQNVSPDVKEDYDIEQFKTEFTKVLENDEVFQSMVSTDITPIPRTVAKALLSVTPQTRYPVGTGARILALVGHCVPSIVTDGRWSMAMPDYLIIKPKKKEVQA